MPKHSHLVQLYETDEVLAKDVAAYFAVGLGRGDSIISVATPDHQRLFLRELHSKARSIDGALAAGQICLLDARETLGRFFIDGDVSSALFEQTIDAQLQKSAAISTTGHVRVYGELVAVLWAKKQFEAAIALERLWNDFQASREFELYCAYHVDVFDSTLDMTALDGMLCTHTHLVPAGSDGRLEAALQRAMSAVLGPQGQDLRPVATSRYRHAWAAMPRGEAIIFWLRENLPDKSTEILDRARHYYRAAS